MKKMLFGLLVISLFFTSCKKDEISPLKVAYEGFVYDHKTNEPLAGVTLEIRFKNEVKSTTTDESGFYSLRNIPAGFYYIEIKKNGYLEEKVEVGNTVSSNSTTEEIVMNSNYLLSPLSEELTFTLLIRKANNNAIYTAAPNVTFKYRLLEYADTLMEGTTDENGLVHLTGIPYSGKVFFIFDFTLDGSNYFSERSIYTTDNNESVVIYEYIDNGSLGIVSSDILKPGGGTVDDFSLAANSITIKFTQPIDIKTAKVSTSFGADTSWSASNTVLTLEIGSSLSADTEYSVGLQLTNEEKEDSFNRTIYFRTEPMILL
jgi:hypothetical protein